MSISGGPLSGAPISGGASTGGVVAATEITLTGPSTSQVNTASTNFTVGANGSITGTVTVTPVSSTGTGSFSPTTVQISNVSPTATFTYTGTSLGLRTITATNDGGLASPSGVSHNVTTATITVWIRAPYLATDSIITHSCQLYDISAGSVSAIGSAITAGFMAIPNIPNGYVLKTDVVPNGSFGDFFAIAVFSNINGSQKAAVEVYSPPTAEPTALEIIKVAPFLSTDTLGTVGYQLYDENMAAVGSRVTANIASITGVTNGRAAKLSLTPDSRGGANYTILWDA
jgi:hypothetical protein